MPDYQKMYVILFNAITDAICILQKSQQTVEEIFISGENPIITLLPTDDNGKNGDGNQI